VRASGQDEAGTAVYKTVELDTFLHRTAPQHREVQGHESPLFQSYFPQGIRILKGGVESGFHHVGPVEYKVRAPLFPLPGCAHFFKLLFSVVVKTAETP